MPRAISGYATQAGRRAYARRAPGCRAAADYAMILLDYYSAVTLAPDNAACSTSATAMQPAIACTRHTSRYYLRPSATTVSRLSRGLTLIDKTSPRRHAAAFFFRQTRLPRAQQV